MEPTSSKLPELDSFYCYGLGMTLMEACARFQKRFHKWPRWAFCQDGHIYTHSAELLEWLAQHNITVADHPDARGMWYLGPIPPAGGDSEDTDG